MIEPEPWNLKYPDYQKGFIQGCHNRLGSTLDTFIDYFIGVPKIKEEVEIKIHLKEECLYMAKVIHDDLYNDLVHVRRARNEFVKAVGEPDEAKIRENLNKIKSLWWDEAKRNKYSLYRLLYICINEVHIALTNSEKGREMWNDIFRDAK